MPQYQPPRPGYSQPRGRWWPTPVRVLLVLVTREIADANCSHQYECPDDSCGGGCGFFHVHVFSSLSPKLRGASASGVPIRSQTSHIRNFRAFCPIFFLGKRAGDRNRAGRCSSPDTPRSRGSRSTSRRAGSRQKRTSERLARQDSRGKWITARMPQNDRLGDTRGRAAHAFRSFLSTRAVPDGRPGRSTAAAPQRYIAPRPGTGAANVTLILARVQGRPWRP